MKLDIENAQVVVEGGEEVEGEEDFECVVQEVQGVERISCGQRGYTAMLVDRKKL